MKRFGFLIFILILLFPHYLFAQGGLQDSIKTRYDTISFWTRTAEFGATFKQIGLKNWVQGGAELISLNLTGKLRARKEKERYIWQNLFEATYTLTKQGEQKRIRANTDDWRIITRYNWKLENNWAITMGITINSQFGPLYKVTVDPDTDEEVATLTSDFFAPGFIWPSFGFTKMKKDIWMISLMPVTGKIVTVLNDSLSDAGAFGVDPGEKFSIEAGFGIDAWIKTEIFKNMSIESDLNIFSHYYDMLHTDVRWNFTMRFKVNKFFSAFYQNNLIYDYNIVDKVQFKYTISLGFAYDITW
jgi:hypothetical protein